MIPVRKKASSFAILMLLCLLAGCITIDEVDQPSTAQPGQTITISVKMQIQQTKDNPKDRIYFGFLAPRDWHATANTTVTYTSDRGDGKMSLVSPDTLAMRGNTAWPALLHGRFGIGVNVLKDMEWITFQTDATFPAANGGPIVKGTIKVVTKTGMRNEIVRLGYYATAEDVIDPIDNPFYTKDLHIIGGKGQMIDFSHPQTATIVPIACVDNDYLTITFDGNARPTNLTDASAIYIQATAYTKDKQAIKISDATPATRLAPIGNNKWQIQIWPRAFFQLKDDQSLTRMEYSFVDKTGKKAVYDQSGAPFRHEFSGQ